MLGGAGQLTLDVIGHDANLIDGCAELFGADGELIRPVPNLVLLAHVDPFAILSAAIAKVIAHGGSP
jgi:hypothetical protein